jgi:hypothetical protein
MRNDCKINMYTKQRGNDTKTCSWCENRRDSSGEKSVTWRVRIRMVGLSGTRRKGRKRPTRGWGRVPGENSTSKLKTHLDP